MNELINDYAKYLNAEHNLNKTIDAINQTCKEINGENYQKPIVRIVNPLQVYKYMKNGVKPITIYPDRLTERIVFVFYKDDTKDLYRQGLKHEL